MVSLIKRGGLVGGAAVGFTMIAVMLAGAASATDPVTAAFTDMQAKVVLYGGAIVALVVVSAALFLGIKYLRKGTQKA